MRGKVLFWLDKDHDGQPGGFGFIKPDDQPTSSRETNVFFGSRALAGITVRAGDRVEFAEGKSRPGKGPSASRVWLCETDDGEITTLHGEFDA